MIIVVPAVDQQQPPPEPTAPLTLKWDWITPTRTWNLTDLASPVIKIEGASGLGAAELTHWFADSPRLPGSSWNGYRADRGEVFLPVMVSTDDVDTFLAENRAFLQSLDPAAESTLRITRPDGAWRQIGCRYTSGADLAADYDPILALYASYGLTFATADPYWSGEQITVTYVSDVPAPFFPGPPFALGDGLNVNDAHVTNPGDVGAFPLWRVWGPFTGFTVGVGDAVVSMTLTREADGWVEIDMDPLRLTMLDSDGNDCWASADDVDFAAIPPGVDVPLSITVSNSDTASKVDLSFTPRYRAAW